MKKNLAIVFAITFILFGAVLVSAWSITGNALWSWNHCTASNPCLSGEGDCDKDSHCRRGLECRQNVGSNYGQSRGIDVCEYKKAIPCGSYGDVNEDGFVTTSDARLTSRRYHGERVSINEANLDVNGIDSFDFQDVIIIIDYLEGNIDTFPVCGSDMCGSVRISECTDDLRFLDCIDEWQIGGTASIDEMTACGAVWREANGGEYCIGLLNRIANAWQTSCGDPKYNRIADINKDKKVDVSDHLLIVDNFDNEPWCKIKLEDTTRPCGTTIPTSEVTYQGVLEMLGKCDVESRSISISDSVACKDVCPASKTCVFGTHLTSQGGDSQTEIIGCGTYQTVWFPTGDNLETLLCMCCSP